MKFESCSFNVVFPEIVNIREKIFELEKKLVGFGRPFNLISVPMDCLLYTSLFGRGGTRWHS